MYADL